MMELMSSCSDSDEKIFFVAWRRLVYDQAADLEEGVENGLREMELSELAANRRGLEEFHQHLRQPPERRHIVLLCDEGVLHRDNSINLPGHLLDEDGQDATHHEIGPS